MLGGRRARSLVLSSRSIARIESRLDPIDLDVYDGKKDFMDRIDRMGPKVRALVHEYGYVIVDNMLSEGGFGERNAGDLEFLLRRWRDQRQDQWLATNYITQRVVDGFYAALAKRPRVHRIAGPGKARR